MHLEEKKANPEICRQDFSFERKSTHYSSKVDESRWVTFIPRRISRQQYQEVGKIQIKMKGMFIKRKLFRWDNFPFFFTFKWNRFTATLSCTNCMSLRKSDCEEFAFSSLFHFLFVFLFLFEIFAYYTYYVDCHHGWIIDSLVHLHKTLYAQNSTHVINQR